MDERGRWAVYAAITASLATKHPKRHAVARALEALVRGEVPRSLPNAKIEELTS